MGVFLWLGLAFELGAEGFEEGLVLWLEGIGQGAQEPRSLIAVTGMDQLLDGDGGNETPSISKPLVFRVLNSCSISHRRHRL